MGKNRSWESHHKGLTHAFILEFASQDDLDYYLTEEKVHGKFSKLAKPLIEDSVVVDIVDGELFGGRAVHPRFKNENGGKGSVHEGSCHCESVRWVVRLEKAEHVLCHCLTCQKLGGGPYSCNQIITEEDLLLTEGEGNVGVYKYKGASGKNVECFFCKTCTSHVYHKQEVMPGRVIVRTLLLEGGGEMPATGEIFGEGRLGWVTELRDQIGNTS
ncbi:hypothetical protein P154DRAFT_438081 [Amniculicola lignicola CBS 123094]|uniref:CENP-V/GFA domain-containing protein n=1 Tax=Amniculicola lignicola CBS 123094 TaxID=1392246 RepID=A0A6A5WBF4_9PLEO|nr:hypothetical protein P154DRAFT_438081 [Amniculicola lignicola CBS 123094]